MITLYSGTPGAGKSLHVARKIYERLRTTKRNVIATFPINMDIVTKKGRKKAADFIYCDITDMSTEYLINYALQYHKLGIENQTLVIIDECQIIFNPREFSRKDRLKWIVFFTQHRKLGFDFILISQFDRLIDRQIRCLLEYNVIHRKVNNLGILWMLPIKFFVAINVWYGAKVKCGQEFFIYRKKYGKMYDSFMMFDDAFKEFVKESGEKISPYNIKKLGLDKPVCPAPEPDIEADEVADADVIDSEIEQYVHILSDLPEDVGGRNAIVYEVNEAFDSIHDELCENSCTASGGLPEMDKNVLYPESSAVEAGDGGSLPKQTRTPDQETLFNRIWKFLNKPITLKRD